MRLRRTHPCGGDTWLVDRLGADIGLRCRTCGRHVLIERPTLERRFAAFVERGDPALTAAVSPGPDPAGGSDGAAAGRGPVTQAGGPIDAASVGTGAPGANESEGPLAVFRNPAFLRLWLSQAATQIGGNMVLFGLTVIVSSTQPNTAVSLLILSFLVPAVLFSAVAGVYVDRIDRRLVLITTNILRGFAMIGLFLVGDHFLAILLLNIFVSTVTVFFAPAEAAMIPEVVPRRQLLSANGVFTLTLNAAFAIGFALLGPLVINIAGRAGRDPHRRRAVLPGRRLLFHAAGIAAAAEARRPTPGRIPSARRARRSRRPWRSCARGSTSSAATARSAGRCSISGSPHRSSACSACSGRTSRSRPSG